MPVVKILVKMTVFMLFLLSGNGTTSVSNMCEFRNSLNSSSDYMERIAARVELYVFS